MWSFIGVLLVVPASFPADTSHTLQERASPCLTLINTISLPWVIVVGVFLP
jgi:hypothetical protein